MKTPEFGTKLSENLQLIGAWMPYHNTFCHPADSIIINNYLKKRKFTSNPGLLKRFWSAERRQRFSWKNWKWLLVGLSSNQCWNTNIWRCFLQLGRVTFVKSIWHGTFKMKTSRIQLEVWQKIKLIEKCQRCFVSLRAQEWKVGRIKMKSKLILDLMKSCPAFPNFHAQGRTGGVGPRHRKTRKVSLKCRKCSFPLKPTQVWFQPHSKKLKDRNTKRMRNSRGLNAITKHIWVRCGRDTWKGAAAVFEPR